MTTETKAYEGWAIVELMGHRRLAGQVSEVAQYGQPMLRLDVPKVGDAEPFTQFYAGAAVFSVTPTSEEIAMRLANQTRAQPISRFDLALPPMPTPRDAEFGEDHCGED